MESQQYIALLRGINVGGNNIIKMSDLKLHFENMGFTAVLTYIQSGNVLFKSYESDKTLLIKKLEQNLSERYNYNSCIFLLTYEQLKTIVNGAPHEFGKNDDKYRYDVVFLRESVSSAEIIKEISVKEGVDEAIKGGSVIYFTRLIEKASQSYLTKIVSLPFYKDLTIRNWNTTTRLLKLSEMS